MPTFDSKTMKTRSLMGSAYGFSGTRIEDLGASEYTLVTIVCDESGSVNEFRTELEQCIQHIVAACRRSPRADNLMLRLVAFDDSLREVHGFKPLSECHASDYQGFVEVGGMTSLYDASVNSISAMTAYSKDLSDHGFSANGIVFILTDGGDNTSVATAPMVADVLKQAVHSEHIESLVSVLVGVNVSGGCSNYLMNFSASAGFTQYIEIDRANENTLAGLANFASRSVMAQSVMLGSGQSVRLQF